MNAEGRDHLRKFLTDYDPPCPSCGYNLHGVTGDLCPECGRALVLDDLTAYEARHTINRVCLAGLLYWLSTIGLSVLAIFLAASDPLSMIVLWIPLLAFLLWTPLSLLWLVFARPAARRGNAVPGYIV